MMVSDLPKVSRSGSRFSNKVLFAEMLREMHVLEGERVHDGDRLLVIREVLAN